MGLIPAQGRPSSLAALSVLLRFLSNDDHACVTTQVHRWTCPCISNDNIYDLCGISDWTDKRLWGSKWRRGYRQYITSENWWQTARCWVQSQTTERTWNTADSERCVYFQTVINNDSIELMWLVFVCPALVLVLRMFCCFQTWQYYIKVKKMKWNEYKWALSTYGYEFMVVVLLMDNDCIVILKKTKQKNYNTGQKNKIKINIILLHVLALPWL